MASTSRLSVFISYVHHDLPVAEELRSWLSRVGGTSFDVFLAADEGSLPLGSWWFPEINAALRDANLLLVIVSPAALFSQWVAFESGVVSGQGKPVIPVLLPTVESDDLAEPLRQRQLIQLNSPRDLERVVKCLNEALGTRRRAVDSSSAFRRLMAAARRLTQSRAVAASFLASRKDLYSDIIDIVTKSPQPVVIRATSTHRTNIGDDAIYQRYLDAVARKCAASASTGGSGEYTLVMSFRPTAKRTPPQDRRKAIANRCEQFKKYAALDCVNILQIDQQWSLDLLTINDDYALIGFPAENEHRNLRNAIRITDHDFVRTINRWFDRCVLPRARQIDLSTMKVSRSYGLLR